MMGSYGVTGDDDGVQTQLLQEPEQQPGAGRTRLGLLWQRQSSEWWLLPGFVNVGQCSHTPTEMALFSKIQPAPTAL